jgi:hypothetical protein
VFRNECISYEVSRLLPSHDVLVPRRVLTVSRSLAQNILPVARPHFRALQGIALKDVVLLATIPGHLDSGEVELTMEIWPTISTVVPSVTIALESGASVAGSWTRQ